VAIDVSIDGRAEAVNALVNVDPGLDRLLAEIGAVRDVDFLIFVDELDNRHVDSP
jgi:hypothetical protein